MAPCIPALRGALPALLSSSVRLALRARLTAEVLVPPSSSCTAFLYRAASLRRWGASGRSARRNAMYARRLSQPIPHETAATLAPVAARIRDAGASASQSLAGDLRLRLRIAARWLRLMWRVAQGSNRQWWFAVRASAQAEHREQSSIMFTENVPRVEACDAGL